MEFLLTVLLIVVIYLLITHKSSYDSKLAHLEVRIFELQRLLKQSLESRPTAESPKVMQTPKPTEPEPLAKPEITQSLPLPVAPTVDQPKIKITEPSARPTYKTPVFTPPEPRPSFFERHPDLEKFIGENLVNKIGIAILVLAIGFFVKYAIDNNWVGPVGRVGIGILCGAILIAIAHRLRNSYKAFSSVLVGGGLAIFYFTITLAYHQFHLFNQTTSFIILIVITLFAVILSLLYDKQELAVIALVGGLASPFMVSSGQANYNALFIYLIILNAGLLAIAYFKLWRILNATAFGLTVLICAAIVFTLPETAYTTGFWYCSVLYLLFFAINVANNIKENKAFIASDFSILLINTALYFSAGLYLLTAMHHYELRGLFSAALAVLNLSLSFILFKVKRADTNILYLLIGITLTFISLTAPIQLHGHYITMFWAAEAVLLYWLYLKSGISLMKLTSLIIWGTMIISLLMDWEQLYSSSALTLNIIANKGFITTLMTAFSSYSLFILIEKDEPKSIYNLKIKSRLFQYAAFALLFLSGLLEINHQFLNRHPDTSLNILYLMLYVPAFAFGFQLLTQKASLIKLNSTVSLLLLSMIIIIYILFIPNIFDAQYNILVLHKASPIHFITHWVGAVIVGLLFYKLIKIVRQHLTERQVKISSWIIAGSIVLFLSLEFSLASNMLFYSDKYSLDRITTVYIKTGLPVLWGLSSFALMWLGMRYKVSNLRIISLTLFSVTLLKLFLFDIRNIPPAGKIAAFFCLGVLLLIVSFMYQKVKKIIVQDESTPEK
ncbi:DUF2339 domain-containing protein [Mucilaginibacter lacusdianchii]|uniref:DUF2339 domain-containing protein n=1 Tax=Mucilaginibacter lacusdianchii TaxID=2684211 RepID=UPI00131E26DC|nr:DUF2339 domain-containing protein [Mucilaginibacter sp. JXJ CY 39]